MKASFINNIGGFRCSHCKEWVTVNEFITASSKLRAFSAEIKAKQGFKLPQLMNDKAVESLNERKPRTFSPRKLIGTSNRNHCPSCLWSKHVDLVKPGDRKSECQGSMEPIGLTFKQEGLDKYGRPKQGEIMIIHKCAQEGRISINRIAADDNPQLILEVLDQSKNLDAEIRTKLEKSRIRLLTEADKQEIDHQLFGI